MFHWRLHATRRLRFEGSRLRSAKGTVQQHQAAVKLYGVSSSLQESQAYSLEWQVRWTQGRDSGNLVKPFMQVDIQSTRECAVGSIPVILYQLECSYPIYRIVLHHISVWMCDVALVLSLSTGKRHRSSSARRHLKMRTFSKRSFEILRTSFEEDLLSQSY